MTQKLVYKDKRNLFCCESVYQLFNAIVIKMTIIPDEPADIILSEHTDFSHIAKQLEKTKIFSKVIQPECRGKQDIFWSSTIEERIEYFQNPLKLLEFPSKYAYTDLYIPIDHIYWKLLYYSQLQLGYKADIHFYEEGLRAYTMDIFKAEENEKYNNNFYGDRSFTKSIVDFYVYEPELFSIPDIEVPIKTIPKINKNCLDLVEVLTTVFPSDDFPKEKYIFFEESYIGDKRMSNDFQIFEDIVETIGRDNIIVKRHPRNLIDRFTPKGYKVMDNWKTPWEVQLLTNDVSDKFFITISSTASVTPFLLFNQQVKSMHLLNMFIGESPLLADSGFKECYLKMIDLCNREKINIYTPKSKEEIKEIISYLKATKNL